MTLFEISAANLLSVLFSASIRVAILIGLSLATLKILRGKAAPLRHGVWTFVLAAMLLMPFLRTALPPLRLRLLPFPSSQSKLVQENQIRSNLGADRMAPGDIADPKFVGLDSRSKTSGWPGMVLAVYVAVSLFLLGRLLLGLSAAGNLVRDSQLLKTADLAILARQLSSVRKIPDLRQSPRVRVPVVVGILNPSIILPADWSRWKKEKLTAVLAHELSHVQRHDPLLRFLSSLNKCLYWFHPMAWWLDRHLSDLAEELSDDSALAAIPDRRNYAHVLLEFAAIASKGAGRIHWAGMAIANRGGLGARIERILSHPEAAAARLARHTLAVFLVAALLTTFSTAAIELAGDQRTQSSKSVSTASTESAGPKSFEGTWQGVWHDTWMGSQSSLSLTLSVKAAANGKLSGTTSTSAFQQQATQKQNPRLSLGAPPAYHRAPSAATANAAAHRGDLESANRGTHSRL